MIILVSPSSNKDFVSYSVSYTTPYEYIRSSLEPCACSHNYDFTIFIYEILPYMSVSTRDKVSCSHWLFFHPESCGIKLKKSTFKVFKRKSTPNYDMIIRKRISFADHSHLIIIIRASFMKFNISLSSLWDINIFH